jgi:hypothetical protein
MRHAGLGNSLKPQRHISNTIPANTISSKQPPGAAAPHLKHDPSKHHIIQAAPWYTSIFQATPWYHNDIFQAQPQQTPYHPSNPWYLNAMLQTQFYDDG